MAARHYVLRNLQSSYRTTERGRDDVRPRRARRGLCYRDCWSCGAILTEDEKVRKPRPRSSPQEIVYGVDDRPPPLVTWVAARAACPDRHHGRAVHPDCWFSMRRTPRTRRRLHMTSVCMLALGIGTILSCLNLRDLGSGYLMPASFSGVYFSVSILAARQGGLPLVAGMTMFAGLIQLVLSRLVRWLRPYLPTEIAGFAMLMSGFTLAVVGFNLITGVADAVGNDGRDMGVPALLGIGCILVMVGLHVWGSAALRIYTVLIGLGGRLCRGARARPCAARRAAAVGPRADPLSRVPISAGRFGRQHDGAVCGRRDRLVAAGHRRSDDGAEDQRRATGSVRTCR